MAAPNTTERFLVKTPGMTFLGAEVRGEGGDGVMMDPGEDVPAALADVYQKQPAQTQRREDWGHEAHGRILLGDKDSDETIRAKLRRVSPPPDFARPDMMCRWEDHQVDAWRAFVCIQDEQELNSSKAMALLRSHLHGLWDNVSLLPKPILITGTAIWSNGEDGKEENPFLAPGADQVECEATLGFSSLRKARESFQHKRFVVGLFYHANAKHWVGFCFDRYQKDLLFADTMESGRMIRFRRGCIVGREMFARLGLPQHFNAYNLPVSSQPSHWECGLLACWTVTNWVRNLVGVPGRDLASIVPLTTAVIDGTRLTPVNNIAIHHQDWLLAPWRPAVNHEERKIKSLQCIKAILSHMLLNELGVSSGRYMKAQGDDMEMDVGLAHGEIVNAHGLRVHGHCFEPKHFFTDRGGVQFIKPNHVAVTLDFKDFRIIPPPNANGEFPTCRISCPTPPPVPLRELPIRLSQEYASRGLEVQDRTPKKPSSKPGSTIMLLDTTTDEE